MSRLLEFVRGGVEHYNPRKYWKRRNTIVNPNSKCPRIIKYFYLWYLKRCEAFNCSYIGTKINGGAIFKSVPNLPHGIQGIFVHSASVIGSNCTIYQQVTIGARNVNLAPVIGDNVFIGAGAKILGDIKIGNNVKIGANAVVVEDVPDNCTVIGVPGRIVKRRE